MVRARDAVRVIMCELKRWIRLGMSVRGFALEMCL